MKTGSIMRSCLHVSRSWLALLPILLCNTLPAPAQALSSSHPAGNSFSIPLEYREASADIITVGLPIETRSSPFSNEPTLSPRHVRRGTFTLGANTRQSLKFIWDKSQGRLYLDLNRNGDFSDDPAGVFASRTDANSDNYQQFGNVRFDLPINGIPQGMLFTLSLYDFGQLGGSIATRSYWSGKLLLQSREWELGVVAPLQGRGTLDNGELLLRPWSDADLPFHTGDGSLVTFPCGSALFFQDRAYAVQRAVDAESPLQFQITLTPLDCALGEVRFTGQNVRRALLTSNSWTVLLDQPSGNVPVPLGTYHSWAAQVGNENAEATLARGETGPGETIVVQSAPLTTVAVGGPLTNSVTLQRRGQLLVLNYQLIGAAGEVYRPITQNGAPPRFAIYRGDRLLEAGVFEFG